MLDNKTPHEVLLGKDPSYKHIKVFGCLEYAFDTLGKQDKFVERRRPFVFMGYLMGQKGYELYDIKSEKTYVIRNVTFIEDVFPFGNNFEMNKDLDSTDISESLHNLQQEIIGNDDDYHIVESRQAGDDTNDVDHDTSQP